MRKVGILLLAIGLVIALVTGIDFITKKKVVDIGSIEITADEKYALEWSPLVGLGVFVAGGVIYLLGAKKA
jgi:hypothetical protein